MEIGEKFIVLLRHGIAEPHGTRENDDERVLTSTGNRRMKQIGRGLSKRLPKAELIFVMASIVLERFGSWPTQIIRRALLAATSARNSSTPASGFSASNICSTTFVP